MCSVKVVFPDDRTEIHYPSRGIPPTPKAISSDRACRSNLETLRRAGSQPHNAFAELLLNCKTAVSSAFCLSDILFTLRKKHVFDE